MVRRHELGGQVRHRRAIEIRVRRNPLTQPGREVGHVKRREGVSDWRTCVTASPNPRTAASVGARVYDRRVAAVHELPNTERLDAQLDCPPAVRRHVEEGVRVDRRADVQAAQREPLELERAASAEHCEEDAEIWPALAAEREPGDVRLLHPRRVADNPLPPVGSRSARGEARIRMDEHDRSCCCHCVERVRAAIEVHERRRTDGDAHEAVTHMRRGEGEEPSRRVRRQLARSLDPCTLERIPLVRGELLEGEARLQGEHGDVDSVAIERAKARFEAVLGEVDGEATLTCLELVAVEQRWRASFAQRGHECLRPEVLMHVVRRRHAGAGL